MSVKNYSVKVFASKNAIQIDNQTFDTLEDAYDYFNQAGSGESYWVELHKNLANYSITVVSTLDYVSSR